MMDNVSLVTIVFLPSFLKPRDDVANESTLVEESSAIEYARALSSGSTWTPSGFIAMKLLH